MFIVIVNLCIMMNFTQAVKGQLSTPAAIMAIQSQAETELGRNLSKEEESILFSNASPKVLLGQIQKYGYGFLKFQLFMSQRPEMSCEASPNLTPRDGNCLIHAICDSILNNDAMKHNEADQLNETWVKLLQDLQFYEDIEDHILFLRTRWVLGAAEWMSGGHNSKQNDKEIFEYNDEEWNYIWDTMLEDGAWAVPSVKDAFGNIAKANLAPEILIKYIAHDLKCHIIIFDLLLGQVQFCSANHVKDNNASFDSPILLYSTGGHFQSVNPKNQEYFIQYARELEERNNTVPPLTNQGSKSDPPPKSNGASYKKMTGFTQQETIPTTLSKPETQFKTPSKKHPAQKQQKKAKQAKTDEEFIETSNKYQCLSSDDTADSEVETSILEKMNPVSKGEILSKDKFDKREYERARKKAYRANLKQQEKDTNKEMDRKRKVDERREKSIEEKARIRAKNTSSRRAARDSMPVGEKDEIKAKNTSSRMTARDSMRVEDIVEIRTKDRSSRRTARDSMPVGDKDKIKAKNTSSRMTARDSMPVEDMVEIRTKDRSSRKNARDNMTYEEKVIYNARGRESRQRLRKWESEEQACNRKSKNKEMMRKRRQTRSQLQRLLKFQESVRFGPIFTCSSCYQNMFRDGVTELTSALEDQIREKSSELHSNVFKLKHIISIEVVGKQKTESAYICTTCKTSLKKGNMPSMCAANGLELVDLDDDLKLTELENNIIARIILFQKIFQLPKSRMAACKDKLINIPISEQDVLNSVQNMPRTPNEAGLLEVKLKRKMEYNNVHKQSYVDPKRIYKALEILKKNGHPHYQFYDNIDKFEERCRLEDPGCQLIFVDDKDVEDLLDIDVYSQVTLNGSLKSCENKTDNGEDPQSGDEEEYHKKHDVIRKFQFDYDKSVCMTERFPEAAIEDPLSTSSNSDQYTFAPGEGKIPENILQTADWDALAFPMKHPDGKNNLHQERIKKLTEQYYFVQRLRNKDNRFSEDPAYIFAAASYIEKKQLQKNVNVSFLRGKEKTSDKGFSTYSLDDGFSVFDNISNTPKYWQKAKNEMLAKLDNFGPFHFFFTLSCADKRWDENLSSILRQLGGISVVYSFDSKGNEETIIKYGRNNEEEKEMHKYLDENVDPSHHEILRTNVMTATRNYDHRVRAFLRDIVRDKNNPMCVQHFTTKVEFQGRGAAHNHGVFWVNMKKMEFFFEDDKGQMSDFDSLFDVKEAEEMVLKNKIKLILHKYYNEGEILDIEDQSILNVFHHKYVQAFNDDAGNMQDCLEFQENLLSRFPLYGLSSAFKKFQTNENIEPFEEKAVINFANNFTKCTLNVDTVRMKLDDEILKERAADIIKIVEEVHGHHHTTSCHKYSPTCRWGFPHFPMWKTLLAKPMKESGEEAEKLQVSYKNILKAVKEKMIDDDVVNKIMMEYPKELDKTREMYVNNRMRRIRMLLTLSGYGKDEDLTLYEDALTYSKKGYSIILERDINEMYINSYNPEWVIAWNGNTDIQPCFDYFAVITYITEYFTKDDTGLIVKLTDILKNTDCGTLKEKMTVLMNEFISARQMGEAEALYKILPNLRLKDSNVTTKFVPTNRKDDRSKFLMKVDEKDPCNGKIKKKIENREGWFVEKYDLVDKYTRRDKTCRDIDTLTTSQFWKMYDPVWKKKEKKIKSNKNRLSLKKKRKTFISVSESDNSQSDQEIDLDEDILNLDYENDFNFVMDSTGGRRIPLPEYIDIDNPFPGEPLFMKKRSFPAVLRFHKFKASTEPDDYYFAEALLYTPFRSEEELERCVADASKEGYISLRDQIHAVKSKVMEHLESTEEARYMVQEALDKNGEFGAALDPTGEQENDDCELEEMLMHPDYQHLDPTEYLTVEKSPQTEKTYRPIKVDDLNILKRNTRGLDLYQRKTIERGIRYARAVVKSRKTKNSPPAPAKVIGHGGAGCGKSTVINILKQWIHYILQQPGDNPDCPYVIVAAPTGTAAANVRGQTLHSSFGFSFGNEHFSLSDKVRDKKRTLLENLKVVIIDEISMVKSDQQFQLDMRLREVMQKANQIFGNVSIFYFGDIMQLKPCRGRYIFQPPVCQDYQLMHSFGKHWESFEVIILEENHRQEGDHEYADMLNRIRVGQQTDRDFDKLEERVRPENHSDLTGAMFISCKNKNVEVLNLKRLNEIQSELFIFESINMHSTIKNFKPPLGNKGNVKDTPFLQTLKLKMGARVMLTYNIDTIDCLTNGTRGEIVGFHKNESGIITRIMIRFDESHQGKYKQESNPRLQAIFPGATPIERVSFQYSLAKRTSTVSNTAKVVQFPLCLCFAATSHKFQGQTIRKPNKCVADLRTVFQAAQTYTILSRVENIDQLFILGSLPRNKFYADSHALEELERLDRVSVNKNPTVWEKDHAWSLKICSFNIRSLAEHIEDLRSDQMIMFSDIICLCETWLINDINQQDTLKLNNYELHLNSAGHGKGLAVYYNAEKFKHCIDVKKPLFQITKMRSEDVDVISVYRSSGGSQTELLDSLKFMIEEYNPTIICGDFNLCLVESRSQPFLNALLNMGFVEMVKTATHIKGGHIDHVYYRGLNRQIYLDVMLYSPYYPIMDHDALCATLRQLE